MKLIIIACLLVFPLLAQAQTVKELELQEAQMLLSQRREQVVTMARELKAVDELVGAERDAWANQVQGYLNELAYWKAYNGKR